MAGVKGRSGGARPNSGGARPGAGRKPKPVELIEVPASDTPLAFLLSVMNDNDADPQLRVKAATTAAQYIHTRKQDGGKKDELADKAKQAATGRFAATAAPLKLVGRK